ncbi:MAG: hypothetical protein LLG45_13165 [Actinomycetia bacterium]|nr:hypothetical protein [Actinomycetes bacterium]
MSPSTKVACPVCGAEYSTCTSRGRSTMDPVRNHMKDVHGMDTDAINELLIQRGILRPSPVIDDKMIDDWNAMVASGVIE